MTLNLIHAKILPSTTSFYQTKNLDQFIPAIPCIHHTNICYIPSHLFIKNVSENPLKAYYAYWQENKQMSNKATTSKWKMTSSAKKRNKGKAPAQGYPQDKRPPAGSSFVMHEGVSSKRNQRGSSSLQDYVLAEVTYSNGDMTIVLQEVLSKKLQWNKGVYEDLPYSIKFILDNLQAAFALDKNSLFQRTLKALEIHLVNLEARNDAITSQLLDKKDIHSMDKMTIIGTDYAKFSLKAQTILRSVMANLPLEVQTSILGYKAMFESFDQCFEHFKVLVTTTYPDPANSDDTNDIFV